MEPNKPKALEPQDAMALEQFARENKKDGEPALRISTVVGIATGIAMAASYFGLDLEPEKVVAIAIFAFPVLTIGVGILTRKYAWSSKSVWLLLDHVKKEYGTLR